MSGISLPADATKDHLDESTDDPKLARAELADLVDKFNALLDEVGSDRLQWPIELPGVAYVSPTSFTTTDTSACHDGRMVQIVGSLTGIVYGAITDVSGSTVTVAGVTLSNESLTAWLGVVGVRNSALPLLDVWPEMFGSDGDEVVVQNALDSGAKRVLFNKTYACNAQITIPKDVELIGIGPDAKLDFSGASGSFANTACLYSAGATATALGSVATNIAKDDRQIVFSAGVSVAVGDLIRIENATDSSWSGHRTDYKAGEIQRVHSVTTTTVTDDTIVVDGPIYDDYTAAAITVYRQSDPTRCKLKNFELIGRGNNEVGSTNPINIWDGDGVLLEDIRVTGGKDKSITLTRCYESDIVRPRVYQRAPAGGTSYGVNLSNCQGINVVDPEVFATRHAFTTGGGLSVVNRAITVRGGQLRSSDAAALDLHGNSEHVLFEGVSTTGAQLAGDHVTMADCTVLNNDAGNIQISIREALGLDFTIDNVRLITSRAPTTTISGLFVSVPGLDANTTRGGELTIQHCKFTHLNSDSTRKLIVVDNNGSAATDLAVALINNVIDGAGVPLRVDNTSGSAISLVRIAGNTVIGGEAYDVFAARVEENGVVTSAAVNATAITSYVGAGVAVAASATHTILNITGPAELVCGTINGTFMNVTLTIDGVVALDNGQNAPLGDDEGGTRFASFALPPAKAHKSLKLELTNYSGGSRDFGWNVFTHE